MRLREGDSVPATQVDTVTGKLCDELEWAMLGPEVLPDGVAVVALPFALLKPDVVENVGKLVFLTTPLVVDVIY